MPITPAQFGQTFTEGVKYIKLNKLDKNGLDNSNRLQQADSIIINYPDIGPQEYVIVSTQPQQDYYLLGLVNNPNTSSLNGILDYSFLATSASSFIATPPPIGNPGEFYNDRVSSYGNINGNILEGFDTSSGIYTTPQTPNIYIQVRISGSATSSPSGPLFLFIANSNGAINGDGNVLVQTVSFTFTSGVFDKTFYLTSSMKLIENDLIGFGVSSGGGGQIITVDEFHVSMSLYNSSPIPATSSLIMFTPEEDFYYSDYNPLFGNAEIPQFSNHFMDVDYTSNFTTPVNFDLIISGTADRAQISDSNYSSFAWSNIRYRGSKYNSYKS